jgi:hypothetical protein
MWDELGEWLREEIRVHRARRTLVNLQRVRAAVDAAGFEPARIDTKFFVPWLDASSLEEDEDLRGRWVNLLSHAFDPGTQDESVGQIDVLRQLSTREARLLDAIYSASASDQLSREIAAPSAYEHYATPKILKRAEVQEIYWQHGLSAHKLPAEDGSSTEVIADAARCVAALGNLKRLGLVDEVATFGGHAYAISQFGWIFVEACSALPSCEKEEQP